MSETDRSYKLYSSLPELEQSKTRAEIDLCALRRNYRYLRSAIAAGNPRTRVIAVVKAEAYGHGAPECVRTLLGEGCDFFAVSCIDEAVAVRTVCDVEGKPASILILGYTQPALASQLARFDIIQTLLSEEYARSLQQAAERVDVTLRTHVALDTGMNRIGFCAQSDEEIAASADAIARVCAFSHLRVEGMFTHFSEADDTEHEGALQKTELQAARYRKMKDVLKERGIEFPFHHVCNSAAAISRPQDFFDGVRIGILLFGARPAPQIALPLSPVLRLKTVISHLHPLLPGETVSYGGLYAATDRRIIATVPIGYADGFLRGYSGCLAGVETARGSCTATIVGRICMDQCMLDVTGTDAKVGDTVTFFGASPDALAAYAASANTIDYECLCLISSRVPRCYLDGEHEEEANLFSDLIKP